MTETQNLVAELERMRRVADQLCTAHATLRDRFRSRATSLDLAILLLSAWLTGLAFLDPRFNKWLIPLGLDQQLWIGVLGIFVFCLTMIQSKTEWSSRSEAHARSFASYAQVKRDAAYLLMATENVTQPDFQKLATLYDLASELGTGIPENVFLQLKKKHKIKVELSKIIDRRPGLSILAARIRLFFRDNGKM